MPTNTPAICPSWQNEPRTPREEKVYQRNDERILGDGDFVQSVLASAEEAMEKRHALCARGVDLDAGCSKTSRCKAPEILRSGAYMKVRRSDEG